MLKESDSTFGTATKMKTLGTPSTSLAYFQRNLSCPPVSWTPRRVKTSNVQRANVQRFSEESDSSFGTATRMKTLGTPSTSLADFQRRGTPHVRSLFGHHGG